MVEVAPGVEKVEGMEVVAAVVETISMSWAFAGGVGLSEHGVTAVDKRVVQGERQWKP